ncbi:MAG: small subunit ribosomal protein S4 [Patescibacteria group bacterium]|jgi:small subunit ribosomal protein S4
MGDIKRKRKQYSRPKQLFDRVRIDEENVIVKKYGLKNKSEIWKAKSFVSTFRKRAKNLISDDAQVQQVFFEKLNKLGLKVTSISDVLALNEEDLLDRRLQTVLAKQGLAATPNQARQLIVHKHIKVDGQVVNIPSFWVTQELESKLEKIPQKVKVITAPEVSEESPEAMEVVA